MMRTRLATTIAATLLCLCATAGAQSTSAPLDACIDLGSASQLARAGSNQLLVKNDQDHYRLKFQRSCSDLAYSRKLEVSSEGHKGRLCPSGSRLTTDRDICDVGKIEPIDAGSFDRLRRRR